MAYQQLPNQGYGATGGGYAQPAYAAPPGGQTMTDYRAVLANHPGLLVRQRLRLKNLWVCMLKNKYDVGAFPQNRDTCEPWDDDVFKSHRGLMYATEESECIDKTCCGRWRQFTLRVHLGNSSDNPEILHYHRPFKCPLVCCFMVPWPQEIHTINPGNSQALGKTTQDWRCIPAMCGKSYWRVTDSSGATTHVIERDVCCNENCLAPTCCCPIHKLKIKDSSEQNVVGSVENIFPGCSLRTLCFGNMIDNYRLQFPATATPEDKANILGALFLIDYMVFANASEDPNNGGAQF